MKINFRIVDKIPDAVNDDGVDWQDHAHQQQHHDRHAQELPLYAPHGNFLFPRADHAFSGVQASLRKEEMYTSNILLSERNLTHFNRTAFYFLVLWIQMKNTTIQMKTLSSSVFIALYKVALSFEYVDENRWNAEMNGKKRWNKALERVFFVSLGAV